MKIFYIAPFDLTKSAGHTSHVMATLRELAIKNHQVTLFAINCPNDIRSSARFISVPAIHRRGLSSISFGIAGVPRLALEIALQRPDVVYARYFKAMLPQAFIVKAGGVPLIVEVNSDPVNERRVLNVGRLASYAESLEERSVLAIANGIVAVAESISESLIRCGSERRSKISVVENGVDIATYRPYDRNECARLHELDPNRKRVIFTGAFQVWQGIPDLIAAAEFITRDRADVDFLFVGDGPLRGLMEREIRVRGLNERVRITGFVPEVEVAGLICASDVCVAPYNTEAVAEVEKNKFRLGALMRGSPLKIYAYMACGKPIVASHFREAGAYLAENDVGLAAPPESPTILAEAIVSLLNDPVHAIKMGARGRRLAEERHSWSSVVDSYLHFAESLTNRH